ncbi:phosphohistidine phosphatase SixA [Croceivirga lutea]|uniref:SixA phosphatase family protein n=1 Tax=Croceivirga lutea TaxID=1775167 RepID=UPI00163B042B|nr:histidine phosphatase family protein [Croceivirga lutea]GGG56880.1 phosphohistidine phosphatase SixA [Croceivirga lutea]
MKTLIFIRHGKSSWDYDVDDKDRPLKERGITDAHLIGSELSTFNLTIDYAYSSPANRALHTAMIVMRNLEFNFEHFKVSNQLYDFSGQSVLNFCKNLHEDLNTVLLFGHNYAFTSLVNNLGDKYIENLPTAGMAQLNFEVNSWSEITSGKTQKLRIPKTLR